MLVGQTNFEIRIDIANRMVYNKEVMLAIVYIIFIYG